MPATDEDYAFPEEAVVAYAASLLSSAGSAFNVYGAVQARPDQIVLLALSPAGRNVRLVAPVCRFTAGIISFRSILESHAGETASWDVHGHPLHGCGSVAYFGEVGPKLAASRGSVEAWMRSGRPAVHQNAAAYREDVERMLAERLSRGIYGEWFEIVEGSIRKPLALRDTFALAG